MVGLASAGCPSVFQARETHGILRLPNNRVIASSDNLAWRTVFAAEQKETSFQRRFRAVDDHLLVLHLAGQVEMEWSVGGERKTGRATPGRIDFIPGGFDLGVKLAGKLDSLHIYVRKSVVDEAAQELNTSGRNLELRPMFDTPDLLLEQLGLAVRDAMAADDIGTSLYVDRLAWATAARLVRVQSATVHAAESRRGPLSRVQLARITEYIDEQLDRDISLSDLAKIANLSPVYFSRLFRQAIGQGPHNYVVSRRLHRAKRLLSATDRSIAEIALECGFCHQEHLTRTFRRQLDTTPAAFRKSGVP
jgi:AraC family transcriptional regulator